MEELIDREAVITEVCVFYDCVSEVVLENSGPPGAGPCAMLWLLARSLSACSSCLVRRCRAARSIRQH